MSCGRLQARVDGHPPNIPNGVNATHEVMKLPDRLDAPLRRLSVALDHLEAAAERRAMADSRRADLEEELAVMQDDRSRLAVELDGAMARARKLDDANAEVTKRLGQASATIRAVLGLDEPSAAPGPETDPAETEE
jgi:chromosome segregation ATPase